MCLACCREYGKWIVFSLYLADMILGVLLLAFSLAYMNAVTGTSGNSDDNLNVAFYVFIALCCLLIIAGIMGCVAAAKETRWLMLLAVAFVIFIAVIVLFNLVYLIYLLVASESGKVEQETNKAFNKMKSGDAVATAEYDALQSSLMCCGVYGPADYGAKGPRKSCYGEHGTIPYSKGCCKAQEEMVEKYGIVCAVFTALLFILLLTTIIWSYCLVGCYC